MDKSSDVVKPCLSKPPIDDVVIKVLGHIGVTVGEGDIRYITYRPIDSELLRFLTMVTSQSVIQNQHQVVRV